MQKITFYLFLLLSLFGCKTNQETINTQIIDNPVKTIPFLTKLQEEIKKQEVNNSDSSIAEFYRNNNFNPIWFKDSLYKKGIQWVHDAKYHGLNPKEYNIKELDSLLYQFEKDTLNKAKDFAKLDLALSIAVKKSGQRIGNSIVKPKDYHKGWNYPSPNRHIADSLWIKEIHNNGINTLDSLFVPKHKLYKKLEQELIRLYAQNDNYKQNILKPGFSLQLGDSNKYVLPIKHQLLNISADSILSMAFDNDLKQAVIRFQKQHNLTADGIIGKNTYNTLNWNLDRYIKSIKINMERLRWIPDSVLENGIVINVGNQTLNYYHENKLISRLNVVVGKEKNQTPIFSSNIEYIVFNPCWTIPKSIATTTILRGMKRDSAYLEQRNMFICKNGQEISEKSIDITQFTSNYFPFQVFQRADPKNALGQVKFMFENNYSVYLHDTPQKSLFSKQIRDFSHGCIRVQNALKFSETILLIDHQTKKKEYYLKKGYPVKVYLNHKIPIHLVYLTCHYDDTEKMIVYDKDIYSGDYLFPDMITK